MKKGTRLFTCHIILLTVFLLCFSGCSLDKKGRDNGDTDVDLSLETALREQLGKIDGVLTCLLYTSGLVFAHSGDSGIATWTAPAGAQKYYVQLYKGETEIETWAELGVANISIPIGMLRGNGAGDYRVGVIAVASDCLLYTSVQISISGIPNVYEVDTGVVGGSFKIPYDASIADVEAMADVRIGALLSTKSRIYPDDPDDLSERDDFIFLSNNKDDGNNKASCAWMSNEFPDGIVRFIRDDGVLARVRFKLKDVGTVDLSFEELTLTDILGENLTSSSITVVPGTITVKSRQLAQVGKPAWDSDVITWTNVENAANYEVQLLSLIHI